MRVFTTLPQEDLRKVASAARSIEAEGYDGVASMENKHDPFLALAVCGATPPANASSVAVKARPSSNAVNMLARAGVPTSAATSASDG